MEDATGQAAAQRGPNPKRWDESSEEGSEEEEGDEDAATKAAEDRRQRRSSRRSRSLRELHPGSGGGRWRPFDLLNLSACGIGRWVRMRLPSGAGRSPLLWVARNVLREEGIFALASAWAAQPPLCLQSAGAKKKEEEEASSSSTYRVAA